MLSSLHIENIAVIRKADIDFRSGFSALTGETGAGKSIIIDSINLLLGNRVSRELIRSGESTALVSAVFEDLSSSICQKISELGFEAEDGGLMLQRTLTADGKSQCRINGQTVTQGILKEVAANLVSIHGQSDSQKLLQKSSHLSLVDAYHAPKEALEQYQASYHRLKEVRAKLNSVCEDESERLRLVEMLHYQIEDIDALHLKDGEEEAAEKERDRLLHLEKINQQATLAYRVLSGSEKGNVADYLSRAESALRSLSGIVEGSEELAQKLYEMQSEVIDIAETVADFVDEDSADPTAKIDKLEGRLESISKLKRKYGSSIREILAFRENAQKRLDSLETSEDEKERLKKEEKELYQKTAELAKRITECRKKSATEIIGGVTETLAFLDMPKVKFDIRLSEKELSESGADDIEFMIATNLGEPLQPLIKIASGGELSRIMLALRSVIQDRDAAGTLIFDEIDTGVSGKTSRKIGLKLHEAASSAQVLCVTHSAQIASLANTHFKIQKDEQNGRVETTVKELEGNDRIEEIARILGGIEVTNAQREVAKELISEYHFE